MSGIDEATAARIYRLRLAGASVRHVAEQFEISVQDVNAVVDARLPKITSEYRAQAMRLDLERLEFLTAKCLDQITKDSLAAGHLLLKICERFHRPRSTEGPPPRPATRRAGRVAG